MYLYVLVQASQTHAIQGINPAGFSLAETLGALCTWEAFRDGFDHPEFYPLGGTLVELSAVSVLSGLDSALWIVCVLQISFAISAYIHSSPQGQMRQ